MRSCSGPHGGLREGGGRMVETAAIGQIGAAPRKRRTPSPAEILRRRIRNRENMRRRRQDPAFRAFERRRRDWKGYAPEQDSFFEGMAARPAAGGKSRQRCSICRQREAVEVITRLRPCAEARGGYVQMRIAYCGFC